jgi:hypothetical protein
VYANDVRKFALILDIKPWTYYNGEGHPSGTVIARNMDVVDIERDHCKDPVSLKIADARI